MTGLPHHSASMNHSDARLVTSVSRHRPLHGFTLIELLVVIAIISLLVSILLPSLTKAKELARGAACMANLKNINLAAQYYLEDTGGSWLVPLSPGRPDRPTTGFIPGWMDQLYPYHEQVQLYLCPSAIRDEEKTVYVTLTKGVLYVHLSGGYGYNENIPRNFSPDGDLKNCVRLSQIDNPSGLIFIADSDFLNSPPNNNNYFITESIFSGWAGSISTRHGAAEEGNCENSGGNYLWLDGHIDYHTAGEAYDNQRWWMPNGKTSFNRSL